MSVPVLLRLISQNKSRVKEYKMNKEIKYIKWNLLYLIYKNMSHSTIRINLEYMPWSYDLSSKLV